MLTSESHRARVYDSSRRGNPFTWLPESWAARGLVLVFARRVLLSRHRQTALGAVWALVQATSVGVLAGLVLRDVVSIHTRGEGSYLLLVLGGSVSWTFVSRCAAMASASVLEDGALLSRVWFPREVLPISRVVAGLVDLAIGLVAFAVIAIISGHGPSTAWLVLPLPIVMLFISALALSIGTAALAVELRDINFLIPLVLQFGFFICPVLYPLSETPGGFGHIWGIINPVAGAIDDIRQMVLSQHVPSVPDMLAGLVIAVAATVVSYAVMKLLEPNLADSL